MFGMSFTEILVIAVIAVLFLGPDKLPQTMVQIAKFFKSFKSSVNEAKQSFEQEINIQELKEETRKYKKDLEDGVDGVRKKLTFEELDEIKKTKQSVNDSITSLKEDLSIENPPGDKPKKPKKKKKPAKKEEE